MMLAMTSKMRFINAVYLLLGSKKSATLPTMSHERTTEAGP